MKKVFSVSILFLLLFCLLTGCGCRHEWNDATCQLPKTCTLCGETEGEPLPHNWIDATCTAPKTCALCAATEGAALGHTRGEWVCTGEQFQYPCTVCGEQFVQEPEDFFLELLAGTWKLQFLPSFEDREESITFHEDGTASLDLKSSLVCPDTAHLEAGDLFYTESNRNWGMSFYLEDHLTQGHSKLDPDHGLYLLVTVRENMQENGLTAILQHKGYRCSWSMLK